MGKAVVRSTKGLKGQEHAQSACNGRSTGEYPVSGTPSTHHLVQDRFVSRKVPMSQLWQTPTSNPQKNIADS